MDRNSSSAHRKTQNSTQKRIQPKPKPNPTHPALPLPLPPTPYPVSLTPGIVMARYFDRERERRLLVRVTGKRLTAVFRLPHISQKRPLTPSF